MTKNATGKNDTGNIACVLITHLPVKAELKRYPELRGRPVVITQSHGSKELVLDNSPQARGVGPGMPFRRPCPCARKQSCCRPTGLTTMTPSIA